MDEEPNILERQLDAYGLQCVMDGRLCLKLYGPDKTFDGVLMKVITQSILPMLKPSTKLSVTFRECIVHIPTISHLCDLHRNTEIIMSFCTLDMGNDGENVSVMTEGPPFSMMNCNTFATNSKMALRMHDFELTVGHPKYHVPSVTTAFALDFMDASLLRHMKLEVGYINASVCDAAMQNVSSLHNLETFVTNDLGVFTWVVSKGATNIQRLEFTDKLVPSSSASTTVFPAEPFVQELMRTVRTREMKNLEVLKVHAFYLVTPVLCALRTVFEKIALKEVFLAVSKNNSFVDRVGNRIHSLVDASQDLTLLMHEDTKTVHVSDVNLRATMMDMAVIIKSYTTRDANIVSIKNTHMDLSKPLNIAYQTTLQNVRHVEGLNVTSLAEDIFRHVLPCLPLLETLQLEWDNGTFGQKIVAPEKWTGLHLTKLVLQRCPNPRELVDACFFSNMILPSLERIYVKVFDWDGRVDRRRPEVSRMSREVSVCCMGGAKMVFRGSNKELSRHKTLFMNDAQLFVAEHDDCIWDIQLFE